MTNPERTGNLRVLGSHRHVVVIGVYRCAGSFATIRRRRLASPTSIPEIEATHPLVKRSPERVRVGGSNGRAVQSTGPSDGYDPEMSTNAIRTSASREAVFDVLDDPFAYPRWVIGARRVRNVDPSWPAVGSRFHHAIGTAAGELHDSSKVLQRDPPERMVLEVRFRPTGVARVDIRVRSEGDGSVIEMEETPTGGPVSRLPGFITDPILSLRNVLSLRRLRGEVERAS